jgi:hypothetical protein
MAGICAGDVVGGTVLDTLPLHPVGKTRPSGSVVVVTLPETWMNELYTPKSGLWSRRYLPAGHVTVSGVLELYEMLAVTFKIS